MKEICSSETSIFFYKVTRRQVIAGNILDSHRPRNQKYVYVNKLVRFMCYLTVREITIISTTEYYSLFYSDV
jgi:hypothetical protein